MRNRSATETGARRLCVCLFGRQGLALRRGQGHASAQRTPVSPTRFWNEPVSPQLGFSPIRILAGRLSCAGRRIHPSLNMAREPVRLEEPSAAAVVCPINSDGCPQSILRWCRQGRPRRQGQGRCAPPSYIAAIIGKSAAAVPWGRLAVPSSDRFTMPSQAGRGTSRTRVLGSVLVH